MLILTLVLTKILIGLLLSSALAFGFYLLSVTIVLAILPVEFINALLVTVLTISVGASVGSLIAWFEKDQAWRARILLSAIVLLFAFAGTYYGLVQGIELMPNRPTWQYGLPILSFAIRWAIMSANAPLLALGLYKAARSFRF